MKKIFIFPVVMIFPFFSGMTVAKGHGCDMTNLVFFSYNINHTKAVELCHITNGYRYTFGPIGKPDITLDKIYKDVVIGGGMAGGFSIKNGSFIYNVTEDKYGNSSLYVEKYGYRKNLAEIELDSADKDYVNRTFEYNNK